MPMTTDDSREQTILDRNARNTESQLDRKARTEQAEKDRSAQTASSRRDRTARTAVSLISATAAIVVGYIAALQGIKAVTEQRGKFQLQVVKESGGNESVVRLDTVGGDAAVSTKAADGSLLWKPVLQASAPPAARSASAPKVP